MAASTIQRAVIRGLVGGVDRVRNGGRYEDLGVGTDSQASPGSFAVAGAQRGAVDRPYASRAREQRLHVEAVRVGDGALDVGDGHDRRPAAARKRAVAPPMVPSP